MSIVLSCIGGQLKTDFLSSHIFKYQLLTPDAQHMFLCLEIFDSFQAKDLLVANTWFKKRHNYLVTFTTRVKTIQIDYCLTSKIDSSICLNCKLISKQCVPPNANFLFWMFTRLKKKKAKEEQGIRLQRIKEDTNKVFVE